MTGTGDGLRAAKQTWDRQHWGIRWSTLAGVAGAIVLGANALSAGEKLGQWIPVQPAVRAYVDGKTGEILAMQQEQYEAIQLNSLQKDVRDMKFQLRQLRTDLIRIELDQQNQPANATIRGAKSDTQSQIIELERAKDHACDEIRKLQGWATC